MELKIEIDEKMSYEEKLALKNMNLVPIIYNRYFKEQNFMEKEDVLGYGYVGLCKAAKNYKEGNTKFSSYAWSMIWGEMTRALRDKTGSITSRKDREKLKLNNRPMAFSCFENSMGIERNNKKVNPIYNIPEENNTDIEQLLDYQKVKSTLNEKELFLLEAMENETRQTDLAKQLKTSQANVSRLLTNLKKKIKKAMVV